MRLRGFGVSRTTRRLPWRSPDPAPAGSNGTESWSRDGTRLWFRSSCGNECRQSSTPLLDVAMRLVCGSPAVRIVVTP